MDLQFCQSVGDQRGLDAGELEQLRVAVLDDNCRARKRGQIGDLIAKPALGQAGDQIGQDLRSTRAASRPSTSKP